MILVAFTVVSPRMGEHGWPFANVDPFPAAGVDPVNHAEHIKDLYLKADPDFSGRFTVPVLWDKKLQTIVNNESSEIIRIFNSAFNELIGDEEKRSVDIYPEALRREICGPDDPVTFGSAVEVGTSSGLLKPCMRGGIVNC